MYGNVIQRVTNKIMEKIRELQFIALGLIFGLFLGGIFQAIPRFEWKQQTSHPIQQRKSDINLIKTAIIKDRSMGAYCQLKCLSSGHLKKEDIFYGLVMNESYNNDTIYLDVRKALLEIYNMPPKDTITLRWIRELDKTHINR